MAAPVTNFNSSADFVQIRQGLQHSQVRNITLPNLLNAVTLNNGAVWTGNTGAGGFQLMAAANQKMGFWGATPIVRPAGTGELVGLLGNAATVTNAANFNSNGNTGNAAYNLNDIVKALKTAGLLTS